MLECLGNYVSTYLRMCERTNIPKYERTHAHVILLKCVHQGKVNNRALNFEESLQGLGYMEYIK